MSSSGKSSAGVAASFCAVQSSVAQAIIGDSTNTPLVFDGLASTDPDGFWNPATPDRLTVPAGKGGLFVICAAIEWAGSAAGSSRGLKIDAGGVRIAEDSRAPQGAGGAVAIVLAKTWRLVAGNIVQAVAIQDSGANLNSLSIVPRFPSLSLLRVGA